MRRYVESCIALPSSRRITTVVDEIIRNPPLHARFVNTLARMEYVGVRKLLKSRRADRLDLHGLQHMLDENVHALRLKKAATAIAAAAGTRVHTFSDDDTLSGDAGEAYLQALDHAAEVALSDLPSGDKRSEANYLLTTAAIEVRAQVFYPAYDTLLVAHGTGFSVAAITKDEDRHLAEMAQGLAQAFGAGNWRARFEPLLVVEEKLFGEFLDQVEATVARLRAA
ncbi:MAG: hypothetical protein ABJA82_17280 [Myxococcales bacterium]